MKVKFCGILTVEAAMEAVKQDGDAIRYVLSFEISQKNSHQIRIFD